MAEPNDKSMAFISIIGGFILLLAGTWLRSRAEQFTGDWPEMLSGATPLSIASKGGHEEVVQLLRTAGAK